MNGFLVIDKPGGVTSRDAVNVAQRWFPRGTKIGHTGTLDPLATGVLVLCVGSTTKLADRVQAMPKAYQSRVLLGFTSTTDDADGELTPHPTTGEPPTEERVRAALTTFVGSIQQVPPAFSALKVNGRRAYALARGGQAVELTARPVEVYRAALTAYRWPFADIEVDCGKGTYIRSIARDLGAALGCGGLVQTLRRIQVGPFTVEMGVGLDAEPSLARERLRPPVLPADQNQTSKIVPPRPT